MKRPLGQHYLPLHDLYLNMFAKFLRLKLEMP